jgi:hypothetical protein
VKRSRTTASSKGLSVLEWIIRTPSAPWAVPSPAGRHLAIYDWKLSANMRMMENFLKSTGVAVTPASSLVWLGKAEVLATSAWRSVRPGRLWQPVIHLHGGRNYNWSSVLVAWPELPLLDSFYGVLVEAKAESS